MDITLEGRTVRVVFVKATLNGLQHGVENDNSSEIPDDELEQLCDDRPFWYRYLREHFERRNLSFSRDWYYQQFDQSVRVYSRGPIPHVDICTSIDMTRFPIDYVNIRVMSINVYITDEDIEVQVWCRKEI